MRYLTLLFLFFILNCTKLIYQSNTELSLVEINSMSFFFEESYMRGAIKDSIPTLELSFYTSGFESFDGVYITAQFFKNEIPVGGYDLTYNHEVYPGQRATGTMILYFFDSHDDYDDYDFTFYVLE